MLNRCKNKAEAAKKSDQAESAMTNDQTFGESSASKRPSLVEFSRCILQKEDKAEAVLASTSSKSMQ